MSTPVSTRALSAATFLHFPRVFKNDNSAQKDDINKMQRSSQLFLKQYRHYINGFSTSMLKASTMMFSPITIFSSLKSYYSSAMFRLGNDPRLPQNKRKKIVVLGSGWSVMTFIKGIDVTKYDVTVISPANYFSFTPFLPSVCGGSLSPYSCLEPIRPHFVKGKTKVMELYEGLAKELDPKAKKIQCMSKKGVPFEVNYDYLIVGVGSEANTFGIPGVAENAMYLKNVTDAQRIHNKMIECMETASLPSTTVEQKKKLLSFVVVGGGPSGVEVAAEISDFINKEMGIHFPELKQYAKVTIIEMLPRVLPSFSQSVSEYTLKTLKDINCSVQLKSRVTKITPEAVEFVDESQKTNEIPYGFVLWASGVGQTPFIKHLIETTEVQKKNRILRIDQNLKVYGIPDCFALGDCAWITPKKLEDDVDKLFDQGKKGDTIPSSWLKHNQRTLQKKYPQVGTYDLNKIPLDKQLTKDEFKKTLNEIDKVYMPPPPTAQAASQEALYLSQIFNKYYPSMNSAEIPAWNYNWKGQMSYVGNGYSVIQTPYGTVLGGLFSHSMWKSLYLVRQFSLGAQITIICDWFKVALHGKHLGRPT